MMMEREVADSEGVFSRRLSSNWAELPQTLRKKQKHRPEILSQFTDMSESECEYRRVESSASSHYQQNNNNNQPVNKRVVKRSEFLRRLENRNLLHLQHQPPPPIQYQSQTQIQQQQQFNRRSMPDYRLRYEAQDIQRRSLVNLDNGNTTTHFSEKYNAKLHLSDDERKTNSPDSLLVRSSESESSISDEYGHTDDSGAFLEKASSFDNKKRSSGSSSKGKRFETEIQQQPQPQQSIPLRHRFAKFFTKSSDEHKSSNGKSSESNKLDVNKNNVPTKKESLVHRFEYENIPRIDIAKLEQRSTSSCGLWNKSNNGDNNNRNVSSPQPTIEQLRAEEGCLLRNRRNSTSSSMFGGEQQRSAEEMRLEGLIKDYYTGDEARSVAAERKLSKMETIREEKDGSKLSVREILKRFEELRSQNDSQLMDERSSDRTLTTIQETLKKLDEKVKSYQIEHKPAHKNNHHHQENHVSQISKSIVSQANHSAPLSSHGHQYGSPVLPSTSPQHHPEYMQNGLSNGRNGHGPQINGGMHYQKNGKMSGSSHQLHQQHSNQEWRQQEDTAARNDDGIYDGAADGTRTVVNDGKHSLLQYAMLNFRQSTDKFEMLKTADGSISGSLKVIESLKGKKKGKKGKSQDGAEWTWKEQVDLVKYSPVPIEQSLLRLDNELSALAVECFLCLMRYMGDQPLPPDMSEVKCVYTILMHCHKFELLRDEVYCQLMKQTTNNKSPNPDSCQRGWRLFSIVAAYFTCSDGLKPYLSKYLETAAYDKRRAYHGTATVCLQNLRKTVKYGGRKNVPSVEEIMAISAGRNAKRQIYRLPGGTERVINTKCTTVVQDVIEEMCNIISVRNPHEMDEFSLYCIVDGDAFTMPLARDEYVLDVTTELHKNHQLFYLIFCRSVWYYPLRLDAPLYVEVVFNQIAPDYLEGLLLVLPGEHLPQEVIYDMAQIAALLHRAADLKNEREEPTTKRIKYLLPKPALSLREPRPQQWANMVQQAWSNVQHNSIASCKAQVLEILSKWPLFGSSFFAVKRVPEGKEKGGDHILALNRHGVHFIDLITHETLYHYPYSEVISTRKVKSEEGTLYLDMKCGNLMQQRITRLQTEQAHEISRLIRQYITMEQRSTNNQGVPPIGFAMR
ncbi:hypothetical protein TSAR_007656 [Trichomalopsis sarcophagae]|uniref:MyTH4 domain-containing protein n=1 Tax=Trichomalopsis sarcophagae TaxID=543379 RepID=A0A232FC32_9HYME|nr:hypothetical protein TSAR_007656 [Trichomalopsis sarcophagae]